MSPKLWNKFLKLLTPLLSIVQADLGSVDDAFDKGIFTLLEYPHTILSVDGKVAGLTRHEQTRTKFRLLFLKPDKMRHKGFALVLLQLTERDKERNILVKYVQMQSTTAEDLFVFSSQSLIGLYKSITRFSDLTEENVRKLWDVFTDRTVDCHLRYSAAEQLAIILQGMVIKS